MITDEFDQLYSTHDSILFDIQSLEYLNYGFHIPINQSELLVLLLQDGLLLQGHHLLLVLLAGAAEEDAILLKVEHALPVCLELVHDLLELREVEVEDYLYI
jgi:hypothetical protein